MSGEGLGGENGDNGTHEALKKDEDDGGDTLEMDYTTYELMMGDDGSGEIDEDAKEMCAMKDDDGNQRSVSIDDEDANEVCAMKEDDGNAVCRLKDDDGNNISA